MEAGNSSSPSQNWNTARKPSNTGSSAAASPTGNGAPPRAAQARRSSGSFPEKRAPQTPFSFASSGLLWPQPGRAFVVRH